MKPREFHLRSGIVNRKAELQLVEDRFEDLSQSNAIIDPVLFFYGVPQVGKTTLLLEVRRRAFDRRFPVALVDFDREQPAGGQSILHDYFDGEVGKTHLAAEILAQLVESYSNAPPYKAITLEQDTSTAAAQKLNDHILLLNQAHRKPVVLLFDTLEDIEPDTFTWLKNQLLIPILKEKKCLIVMAARTHYIQLPLEFDWPFSRHLRVHQLRPFSNDQSREQFQHLNVEKEPSWLNKDLVQLTGGLPGLNRVAAELIDQDERGLLQYMVERVIFERIPPEKLGDLRKVILAIAAFRQFDNRLSAQLANHFWPDDFPEASRKAGLRLTHQLQRTTLVEQHPDGFGFVVPEDIRRLLDDYQFLKHPQRHLDTHALAFRWFKGEFEMGDAVSLTEQLYHLAGAWRDFRRDGGRNLEWPEDLPRERERRRQLLELLQAGLEQLKSHPRVDTSVGKIITILKEPSFAWFLDPEEIQALIKQCEQFREV